MTQGHSFQVSDFPSRDKMLQTVRNDAKATLPAGTRFEIRTLTFHQRRELTREYQMSRLFDGQESFQETVCWLSDGSMQTDTTWKDTLLIQRKSNWVSRHWYFVLARLTT